jgi:valyl-tRNA synthetase
MAAELAKVYNPKETESKWYQFWEQNGYFTPKINWSQKPFTIVIPPPNVTGSLHMGHALNNTIQDVIIRYMRMQQIPTLWLPGTDHAGIATQNKVEQQLAAAGLTRYDLGREKFIERVWQWKEKYGSTIINQLKRLGCSCDWTRERFTMDEGYSRAVKEVFARLYKEGLIYRGLRLINWCPRCQTALSDIEVEHLEVEGSLWYIRYPLINSSDYLVIATTRPETMLGDTAIAVNPEDKRYQGLIGKKARLPLIGRELPIIADSYVDPSFGTGALKVTPAHDPYDFEIGERHQLKQVNIFTPDGHINENGGRFQGLHRFKAREAVVEALKKEGLLTKVEPHKHAVGHCYRCHTVIEPYLSEQWFVDMKPLAEPAIKVVEEGKVNFIPQRFSRLYFEWMANIKDWCISRQIWWGHQIPAWYCQDCGQVTVEVSKPAACQCGSRNLKQDEDVLDTWFSSALWPFATLGWPEQTEDLKYFYPTSVLSTARDILYLWVARMIMCGLKFVGDIPFHTVIIHPTVLNWEGRRMSKSLGTGVDPLDLIERYGTDATRFGLMVQSTGVQDMRFSEEKLAMSRNFANKVWNASRLILSHLDGYQETALEKLSLTLADKWIVSRTQKIVTQVSSSLAAYDFGEATRSFYEFFWSDFCDWYLEMAKESLYGADLAKKQAVQNVLVYVLDQSLRLLHPFMPFISEEIWQRLPLANKPASLMIANWPTVKEELLAETAEADFNLVKQVISALRTMRSELKIAPSLKLKAVVAAKSKAALDLLKENVPLINKLAGLSELELGLNLKRPPNSAITVVKQADIYLPLAGLVDIEKETQRLQKQFQTVEQELKKVEAKLSNAQFLSKAPAAVVAKQKAKADELKTALAKLKEQLQLLQV